MGENKGQLFSREDFEKCKGSDCNACYEIGVVSVLSKLLIRYGLKLPLDDQHHIYDVCKTWGVIERKDHGESNDTTEE